MATDTAGELGTILGVWAHPDDEAYLSAGLMATAIAAGRRVVCVTATQGEAGFPADDPRSVEQRKSLRQQELAASLGILGVTEHRWLGPTRTGYGDGQCAAVPDAEAAAAIAAIIEQVRPDTVLTFGPDGGTGHPDHIAASRWTTIAVESAARGSRLLYSTKTRGWAERFMSDARRDDVLMVPDLQPERVDPAALAVWLTCDDDLLKTKVQALRAQSSQVEPFVRAAGPEAFSELVREEFYREPRPGDRRRLGMATD
jgi:LmbE family N-acetylglucosaminyl deacetylase